MPNNVEENIAKTKTLDQSTKFNLFYEIANYQNLSSIIKWSLPLPCDNLKEQSYNQCQTKIKFF